MRCVWVLAVSNLAAAAVTVAPREAAVGRYETAELQVEAGRRYDHPFDPEQVAVDAVFTGPDGQSISRPGFWCVPHRNTHPRQIVITNPGAERYEPAGEPGFRLRFAPTAEGLWRGVVTVREAGGEVGSAEVMVHCRPSERPGFIRRARANPRAFELSDGRPFTPIGVCVAWARGRSEHDTFDWYFQQMAAHGCNAARVWFCHWAWLEWTPGKEGSLADYRGAGWYNQKIAANFDQLLALAGRHGQRVMLCLNNGVREFLEAEPGTAGYDRWPGNPYNQANGGPCRTPAEFWTGADAKRLYRHKLRYLVARWGADPAVWSWEFWNELGQESAPMVAWHREMADYLRQIDAYRRPVTTSSWAKAVAATVGLYDAVDISQLHYGTPTEIAALAERFPDRPMVVGEGTDDEAGVTFHNSLWYTPFCGASGPPLTWLEGYGAPLVKHARWPHYRAVAAFLAAENLAGAPFEPIRPTVTGGGGAPRLGSVTLRPQFDLWLKKAPVEEVTVPPDGRADTRGLGNRLYGLAADRQVARTTPTLLLDYPAAGSLALLLGEVAGAAVVRIELDGQEILRRELPGSGRRRLAEADSLVRVGVPAGQHRLKIENVGSDWIAVRSIVLTNYRDLARYPDLEVYALRAPSRALLWVHHAAHTAEVLAQGVAPEPVVGATTSLDGLLPGRYRIEWWNTTSGACEATEPVTIAGPLRLMLRPTMTDYAVKVVPVGP
ncbi:MAG: DUF5060 domain-containing protein [Armatimonadetes bacterium]|nr:DUF5060 domain-containing protein [Armatimonadota bacterium]